MVEAADSTHTESLTYRILEPKEWHRLVEYCDKFGFDVPSPAFATVAVATDGVKIVSSLFLDVQYHGGPLLTDPEYQEKVDPQKLVKQIESLFFLQEGSKVYYTFTNSPEAEKLAEAAGMKLQPFKVWKKELM